MTTFCKDILKIFFLFFFSSLDGKGRLESVDGIYDGDFVTGYKDGQGKMTWPNNDVYEGHWTKDQMTGNGKFISETATYEGDWENNFVC